jgi:hypothetical protein
MSNLFFLIVKLLTNYNFKQNQFVINRDMSSMFQRFQDGATLFESDSKIFQVLVK